MSRSALLLDVALVLGLSLVLLLLSNSPASVSLRETAHSPASSTPSILPNLALPSIALPSLPHTEESSSLAQEEPPREKMKSPAPSAISATSFPLAAEPVEEQAVAQEDTALVDAAISLRKALVNILCIAPPKSGMRSISGSGVIIDPKGIILTNAHIAHSFLLADRGVSCTVRSGTPAADQYQASLTYIPRAWAEDNKDILSEEEPLGTGEHDYAFLAITGSATNEPLPSSFPFVPLAIGAAKVGTPIAIATYGSQALRYEQIKSALYPTVVFTSVKDIFTFTTTTVDVLSLGGSAAAQQGSSGGGVTDESGALIGTITTSTIEGNMSSRTLGAITARYIRSDYANQTGQALDPFLAQPTATAVASFATQIPALQSILTTPSF